MLVDLVSFPHGCARGGYVTQIALISQILLHCYACRADAGFIRLLAYGCARSRKSYKLFSTKLFCRWPAAARRFYTPACASRNLVNLVNYYLLYHL